MNHSDVTRLVALVKNLCPGQRIEKFTPDAWELILDDVSYQDAKEAVRRIGKRLDPDAMWIDPRQIRTEARRTRAARLDATPTTGAPADPAAYCEWLREARQQIASGNRTDTPALECPPDAQKRPSDTTEARPRVNRRAQLREALRRAASATEM